MGERVRHRREERETVGYSWSTPGVGSESRGHRYTTRRVFMYPMPFDLKTYKCLYLQVTAVSDDSSDDSEDSDVLITRTMINLANVFMLMFVHAEHSGLKHDVIAVLGLFLWLMT